MQQTSTSIRVYKDSRDQLAEIAKELGGVSLDEALRTVLWQRKALQDIRRLEENPEELADYRDEAGRWAEDESSVVDPDDDRAAVE